MDASSTPNSDPPEEPPSTGYEIELAGEELLEAGEAQILLEAAHAVLRAEQVDSAVISIAVVDNATIHDLNRRYLQHDYETDVLSFLLDAQRAEKDEETGEGHAPRGAGLTLAGEIILSAEMARQQAAAFQWRGRDELLLYLVHGLLHLCGYDDLSDSDRAEMRQRERSILARWNLVPHYDESAPASGSPDSSSRSGVVQ